MKKILSLVLVIAISCLALLTSCSGGGNVVKIIDVKLTDEEYAFVCKKGNTELVNSFNAFLDDIKANGKFDELVDKYFKGEGTKVGYEVTTTDVQNTSSNLVVVTN